MSLSTSELELLRALGTENGQLVGDIGAALAARGLVLLTPGPRGLRRAWLTDEGRAVLTEMQEGFGVLEALTMMDEQRCKLPQCFVHDGDPCRFFGDHRQCPMWPRRG